MTALTPEALATRHERELDDIAHQLAVRARKSAAARRAHHDRLARADHDLGDWRARMDAQIGLIHQETR